MREKREGVDRGLREGRKLTGMLVGLIVLDFCAIGTHITTFWVSFCGLDVNILLSQGGVECDAA